MRSQALPSRTSLLVLLAALVFAYILVRAFRLPFTWDESFTWLHFVRGDDWRPETHATMAANNHVLNTWLMRLSGTMVGMSEPALRLPNVLLAMVYLGAAVAFASRQPHTLRALGVFLVLASARRQSRCGDTAAAP